MARLARPSKSIVVFLIVVHVCCTLVSGGLSPYPPHFQQFYRQWAHAFIWTRDTDCQDRFQNWLKLSSPYCDANIKAGIGSRHHHNCIGGELMDCLLEHTQETRKASLAATSVLLSLVPTVLAFAGSNTFEIGILALRRPFLASVLSIGTAAVTPIRAFEYKSSGGMLRKGRGSLQTPGGSLRNSTAGILVALQYVVAAAAAANVLHVGFELGTLGVCSFAVETDYLPLLWSSFSGLIFFLGAVAVRYRFSLGRPTEEDPLSSSPEAGAAAAAAAAAPSGCLQYPRYCCRPLLHAFFRWRFMQTELRLSSRHPEAELHEVRETYAFVILSWLASVVTVAHIGIGTYILSSTLFVGNVDGLNATLRYFGSAIACRVVLMIEIAGMRQTVTVVDETGRILNGRDPEFGNPVQAVAVSPGVKARTA